ncbi:nuclear speckle splicing regulatory protein 1 isoform X2 [Colletes gigas]|nr:nuclear speckle splicing regulatory protein 1 isoform X2 [Colletes gigas]
MQKALKENPTIYQYDEVYDDMERTKSQIKETKDEKKKPKYIENLLKAAERRKREQEHRIERMVQKEREAEGALFADKESFVTSAYRAKLEEFKKLEEEESRMDRLEAIGDVRKQQDMSGFYRHLYEQTVKSSEESEITNNIDKDKTSVDSTVESVNKETSTITSNTEQIINKNIKRSRQYRQRIVEEESDTDTETSQMVENKTNTSLSENHKDVEMENVAESDNDRPKQQIEDAEHSKTQDKITTENTLNRKDDEDVSKNGENDDKEDAPKITAKAKIEAEKKERFKIWEKRTVGPVFEAAVQRYYARKCMKLSTT